MKTKKEKPTGEAAYSSNHIGGCQAITISVTPYISDGGLTGGPKMTLIPTIKRRSFLRLAVITASGGLASDLILKVEASPLSNGEIFPAVEPSSVDVDPDRLSEAIEFIDSEVKAGSIPGAALVAMRHGKKFVEHFSGVYRDLNGNDLPFNRSVVIPLFSFSKGICATVAAIVQQEGLIDYDAPVHTYVPEFTGGGKEAITLRHLLTHSAGIPSAGKGAAYTEEEWQSYLTSVCASAIEWPVGTRTAYHGVSGMFLVAEAIRRVSGMKAWNDICRERLFGPLDAQTLSFAGPVATNAAAVVPSYFRNVDDFGLRGHPAGGAFGSVDDMLRVLNMIVKGGSWQGRQVLKPETLKEMLRVQYAAEIAEAEAKGQQPAFESWGLGWLVRGDSPQCPAGPWFGFGDSTSPTLFGHAGVDTIYGVGDPARQLAFVFVMTGKPRDATESTRLRRAVSNQLQAAIRGSEFHTGSL